MGHQRLGSIPKSKKWQAAVGPSPIWGEGWYPRLRLGGGLTSEKTERRR